MTKKSYQYLFDTGREDGDGSDGSENGFVGVIVVVDDVDDDDTDDDNGNDEKGNLKASLKNAKKIPKWLQRERGGGRELYSLKTSVNVKNEEQNQRASTIKSVTCQAFWLLDNKNDKIRKLVLYSQKDVILREKEKSIEN